MNVLALCAGIGGLELGVKIANTAARCVCYVEGEAYAAAILVKRMGEGWLDKAPVWSDVRTFDGLPWRGKVDCITAGYPCQPFSLAGPMLGEQDQRHLFPHIRRIISEVKPGLCFFENVSNHLRMGFQRVHDDLRGMGYRVAAGLFTAEEVGATHKRERLFILGISGSRRWDQKLHELVTMDQSCEKDKGKYKVSYPKGWGSLPRISAGAGDEMALHTDGTFPPMPHEIDAWETSSHVKPTILGILDGASTELDEIRSCGNAVVPLVAAYAWRVLLLALRRRQTSETTS
jgi:DNA (cytosine-5)-methyltransferase 1